MVTQLQLALQSNNEILNTFLEENDMVHDWKGFIVELQKQNQENALQEQ